MPFQPGNKFGKGRPPKKKSVTHWLQVELDELNGNNQPVAKNLAKKLLTEAKKGEAWAIKEVLDRTEGKPVQTQIVQFQRELDAATDKLANIVTTVLYDIFGDTTQTADAISRIASELDRGEVEGETEDDDGESTVH